MFFHWSPKLYCWKYAMNEASGFNNVPPIISTLIIAEAGTHFAIYIILFFSFCTLRSSLIYFLSYPKHLCQTPALVSLFSSFKCTVQSSSAVRLTCHMLPSAPKCPQKVEKVHIFTLWRIRPWCKHDYSHTEYKNIPSQ